MWPNWSPDVGKFMTWAVAAHEGRKIESSAQRNGTFNMDSVPTQRYRKCRGQARLFLAQCLFEAAAAEIEGVGDAAFKNGVDVEGGYPSVPTSHLGGKICGKGRELGDGLAVGLDRRTDVAAEVELSNRSIDEDHARFEGI